MVTHSNHLIEMVHLSTQTYIYWLRNKIIFDYHMHNAILFLRPVILNNLEAIQSTLFLPFFVLKMLPAYYVSACIQTPFSVVFVVVFVFNVQPIAKVIWRQGRSLKSHPTDW